MRAAAYCFLLLAGIALLEAAFPSHSAAEIPGKKRSAFREGEVLGPDSSTEPLPVELVEDPALDSGENFKEKKKRRGRAARASTLLNSQNGRNSENDEAADNQPERNNPEKSGQEKNDHGDLTSPELDKESNTTLNVKDAEIATLVKSFSKIAKRNYVVDSNVKGKITIHIAEPVTTDEALRILDSVLLLKGFTTVPIGPNTYKVVQAKDAKKTTIPTVLGTDPSSSDALVTQLIRLKNVSANDLQQTMQQFVSPDGLITAFPGTNSLIVIDSAANIDRIGKLVKQLDVPALDQDVTVVPVKYADAKDIAEKVNQILGQDDKSGQAAGGANNVRSALRVSNQIGGTPAQGVPSGMPPPIMPISSSGEMGSKRALPAKVLADERTNSIIVVADPDTTEKIQALIERLDSKVDLSGGRFYVVRLKHADAEELADVLNTVLGGGGGGGSSSSRNNGLSSGSSLSRRSRGNESGFGGNSFASSSSSRGRGRFGGGSGLGGGDSASGNRTGGGGPGGFTISPGQQGSNAKVNFEGEVSIASDPATNSIIINSSKNDYLKVKEVVDILDIRRKQVLVESTILEVTLDGKEQLGMDLVGSLATDKAGVIAQNNTSGGLASLLSNPTSLSNLTIAAASAGSISLPGDITIPSQALILRAIKTNTNVNVLSTPTIVTTDNQEAEIVVGDNIPIVTSRGTNSTNLDNTFNNIDRQDVGITLRLTPQIGAGDFVTMRIFVEISNVLSDTLGNDNGPTTTVRTSETNVEVKSGQMVVTGGLIQDRVEGSDSGIPYWSKIPVFGNLFSSQTDARRKTNLLILITPKILEDQFDAREETMARRDQIRGAIDEQENSPDREDILQDEAIDKVVEHGVKEKPAEVPDPSPITPPKKLLSVLEETRVRESALARLSNTKPVTEEKYSVTVKPKLPSLGPATVNSAPDEPKKADPAVASSLYVVLRRLGGANEIVGLTIPSSFDGAAAKFFQTGSKVVSKEGEIPVNFVCLGKFKSKEEAMESPFKVERWTTLSLDDTLKLGRDGSWTK